jgi:anti-sigma B factor antagonist
MQMNVTAMPGNAARVVLAGRLDVAGAAKIDLPLSAAAGSNRHLLVDISAVTFIASIGVRILVLGAKTIQRRGGKLLLLGPRPEVEQVLQTIGVLDLLPIVRDEAEAIAAFGG